MCTDESKHWIRLTLFTSPFPAHSLLGLSLPPVSSVSQPAAKRGRTGHHPAVASVLAVGGQWPTLHQFVPPPKSGRERPQNGVSSASGCPYFALESEESNVDDMGKSIGLIGEPIRPGRTLRVAIDGIPHVASCISSSAPNQRTITQIVMASQPSAPLAKMTATAGHHRAAAGAPFTACQA
ncbi:hypothetical protein FA13DRAFT_1711622 [Coprinellus micaceus]|uniref:Uncharacterized protein n=1 Tax=Coprinellus micaceus TaxID=71717 RepID=A0A4Y7T4R5_COPMI|nr:hypothetical protein FA13DRAFT_1711622 [Coprinellus micaceus]